MFNHRSLLKKTATALGFVLFTTSLSANADKKLNSHSFLNKDFGGSVFVMSNRSENNEIMVFKRDRRGALTRVNNATTPTGGQGGGDNAPADPLGAQGSLTFDKESHSLFAVNAGDNTISVIRVGKFGIKLRVTDNVSSGGVIPVSTAVNEGKVYVLNAGGAGTVTTFELRHGKLLERSRVSLGLDNNNEIPFNNVFAPGQVGVDTLNRHLIIANAGGQELLTIDLDAQGIPSGELQSTATPGVVPFAFATTRFGNIVVAEAGSGSVSSFDSPDASNNLPLVSSLVETGQAAACWVVIHDNGFGYLTNTVSNTISSFTVNRLGEVEILEEVAGTTAAAPTDMTFANNQRFLYSLDAADGVISGYTIDTNTGKLRLVETEFGLPASEGIQGIASFDR